MSRQLSRFHCLLAAGWLLTGPIARAAGPDKPAAGPAARSARAPGDPTWKVKLKQSISWQKLTPAGVFVIGCPDALYGLDPATGTERWRIEDFSKLAQNNFDPIPGSPFVAVADKVGGKGADKLGTKYVILDVFTGKAVVNTATLGLTNASKRSFLPEIEAFLLFGSTAASPAVLIATNASTGAEKWRLALDKTGKKPEVAVGEPYLTDGNRAFVWATDQAIYKLDAASGRVIWRTASATTDDAAKVGLQAANPNAAADRRNPLAGFKSMGAAFSAMNGKAAVDAGASARATYSALHYLAAPQSPGVLYVFSNDYLTAFELATGRETWTRQELKSPISNIIYTGRGLLVATSEFDDDAKRNGKLRGGLARVNLYAYAGGQPQWGKDGVETDGTVQAYSFANHDADFVVATARANGRNRLDVIALDQGKSKLKKAMTVDGAIRRVMLVPQGLLYITNQEMNILNLETGKDDWAKSVKFKKEAGVVTAVKGEQCYILSDTKLYALNCQTADYRLLADNIPFKGKETPTDFELLPTGIVVKSAQNLQLFDWAGKPQYSYFTPAPGRTMAGKIFFGTLGVLNAAAGAASMAAAASDGYKAGYTGSSDARRAADNSQANANAFLGGAGASFKEMNKRFKATRDGTNLVTMLTTISGGEASDSGVGIKMVDKRTGQEVASLVLDSKKPEYILDDIGRFVFYKAADNEVYGYKF